MSFDLETLEFNILGNLGSKLMVDIAVARFDSFYF